MPRVVYSESTPSSWPSIAIQPWGALEWHGPHLPLGLDSLVAEWFGTHLADRVEGLLFPAQHNPITTLPHPASLAISTPTFRSLIRETLAGIASLGVEKIALVTGHYAQGHMVEVYRAATEVMAKTGVKIYAATPLEPLGDPDLLDHAGRVEASLLLHIRPDLVDLATLPDVIKPHAHAVLGEHPRDATAEEGAALLTKGLEAWCGWLEAENSIESLTNHYEDATALYDEYTARFYNTSWQQAITDWWKMKV